jgi:acetyl esterase/lipase
MLSRAVCLLAVLPALCVMSRAASPETIDLWPEGVPGLHPNAGPQTEPAPGRVANINHPSLTVFRPDPAKANGTAMIICPGGGYVRLAIGHEGHQIGHWLNSLGVTAFMLEYRLGDYGAPAPLQDVLRAIRLVRSRAVDFAIDPHRVGIIGFSAGGHVAATAGTLYDDPAGRTGSPLDAVSARPDFLLLIYPVITMYDPYVHHGSRTALLGKHPTAAQLAHWSPERNVTARTPPAFLVTTDEDHTVPCENSIEFFQALRRAKVPAELHVFEHGPHGFGLGASVGPASAWPTLARNWLGLHGLLPPR